MGTILALHAHPDDIEILCSGTLALLAARGHVVKIVTITAGEGGSTRTTPEQTATIRKAEAARSAAVIGAAYLCGELPDLGVFNDDAGRRRVTEILRWAAPDMVLAPSPDDYHPDHEAVSLLARDACFAATVPNYRTGDAAPLDAIPHLYFVDPIGGRDREGLRVAGDFGVDVLPWLQTKRAMLARHKSQVAWVARQHGVRDPQDDMESWSRRRGRDFGAEAAEGFRQYRHHPYPTTPRLQEWVGEALLRPAEA